MRPRVAVVGGGVSGLAAAYHLSKSGKADVTVWEAGRTGGIIETERTDGFILEKGPDAFITDKPWALELAKELGLEGRIVGTHSENRRSFIARRGRLVPVPEGFYLTAPIEIGPFLRSSIISWPGKFRMMAEPFLPKRADGPEESIGSFVRRRFGREALERVAQPMIAGIYTGDPEKLSLRAALPRFFELEREYGSVTRGLRAAGRHAPPGTSGPRYSLFVSFQDGMQTLTDALVEALPAGAVRAGRVRSAERDASGRWKLELEGGSRETYDAVCVAVSAPQAARILGSDPETAALLSKVAYESVITLNLAYEASQIAHPMNGFGFVVPAGEGGAVIACSFSSRKFQGRAPEGRVLLRAFVGGAFGRKYFEKNDAEVLAAVEAEMARYLGIRGRPVLTRIERYSGAMVQYTIGHLDLVAAIRQRAARVPGLCLTGAAYGGPGIPDCVREAQAAAQLILNYLEER